MFQQLIDLWLRRHSRARLVRKGLLAAPPCPEPERGIGLNSSPVLACFMITLLWSSSVLLMTLARKTPQSNDVPVVGQKAPESINAAFDFLLANPAETKRAREAAIAAEPKFYSISPEANAAIRGRISQFFAAVRSYPEDNGSAETLLAAQLTPAQRKLFLEAVRNPSVKRYVDEELLLVLQTGFFGSKDRQKLHDQDLVKIGDTRQRYRQPKPVAMIPDRKKNAGHLAQALLRFQPGGAAKQANLQAITAVFEKLLGEEGTLRYEAKLTAEAASLAADSISPVTRNYRQYQVLVRKGDVITPETRELLASYLAEKRSRETSSSDFYILTHNMFWCLVLILMGGFYLYHLHRGILKGNANLALLASVLLIALAAEYAGIRAFRYLSGESQTLPPELVADAVPVGLAAVLLAPIMGFRVALGAGFFTASAAALMLNLPFEYALKGIVITLLSGLAVRRATNYRSYFLCIFFTITPLVWIMNSDIFVRISSRESVWQVAVHTGQLALINGIATSMLALLVIFCYEMLFHISTNMSLMLLCDYNHPLLERMKREAPGTFFHSLTVATLAEDGARAIEANYLRAKAGALFHDIGKILRPQYFTENNQHSANMHTSLTPLMSSIIIRSHVKEGMELARKYKLGSVVQDAIEQHHGNDLVHFFYREALEKARRTGEVVDEEQFRYQGRPPQTRETAIISLADACEAASRSLEKPTPERLEALVDKIFEQRFKDGQLRQANITLAELEKVRESFVNTLLSMKHGRIAYREEEEEDHGDSLPLETVRSASAEESAAGAPEKADPAGR